MSYLNLKYIDLSSITIVGSLIFFIWGIIVGLLLFIYFAINGNFDTLSLLIPFTIAFISLVGGIVYYFIGTFIYNIFSKKIFNASFEISNGNIKRISILPISIIITLINIIFVILFYPGLKLVLEVILIDLYSFISFTPMISLIGQTIDIITNPIIILIFIVLTFILTVLGEFIYDLVSKKTGGVEIKLENNNNGLNKINYFKPSSVGLNLAISLIIPYTIINLIISFLFFPVSYINFIWVIIGGFIGIFIIMSISTIFYNLIANKLNPILVELESN
ncbi:hypothetical protein MARBORIA2_13450 [Methanobrevibacter arboriphilus]|jgi:hypothetical protein|uniref:Uncharacterized protein n=1 Tax=Methanobrevibacter arboriphilus TaxID=39441 RepID=A0ACA8R0V2_METAZ|nr:hypothetical protein [Methanobrevibacter arboriphilus]MCC7562151.1 hypothetical protein [Methanobrevibacter arboriphilus]BBL61150.1 hypothetical protein MarbSA_01900 [Methanobrevibacter arboriphilus]GLI12255.1 hypothetical protein MARBORIA2_13450 [Methanobrevibacter arboriphilus]